MVKACYKPPMRPHEKGEEGEEGEEVGRMLGLRGIRDLWRTTSHDAWGIENAPGTGLGTIEMRLEGLAGRSDAKWLDWKQLLKENCAPISNCHG